MSGGPTLSPNVPRSRSSPSSSRQAAAGASGSTGILHSFARSLTASIVRSRSLFVAADRHGPEDRSSVLQCCAIRNGLCRSRGLVLRDALPDAGGQQFASACQGIRLCSPALGAESRCCRFLGIVLQRQLADLGVQRLRRWVRRSDSRPRTEHIGSAAFELGLSRSDLIGVNVELLRQLRQRAVTLDGGQRPPSP
jgi:hypothetical protein